MRLREVAIGIMAATLLFAIMLAVTLGGTGWTPSTEIRPLAKFYLENCFNVFNKDLWAASPEAVCAMLWDYRGIDTYYETAVFFLAVIGGVAIFRVAEIKISVTRERQRGLSIIVKSVSRIVFPLIVITSASVAFHGHLTPGGGFQAGSILAIAPLVLIAAFSRHFIEEDLRLTKDKCLTLRTVGLIAIALIVAIPILAGAMALMQNQVKPWSHHFSYPEALGPLWLAGSLFFYNVAEYLTVGAGFTLLFLLMSIPEEEFRRILKL
ncbi:MAG: Na(+)/H(+) antiporter subunit B [Candidatus Nezhaarchaeota archaeon]|nr:Na(+)/H(+) antiporter subunit B [Candidatus Nezhaarchaeota archaeon]MCX8142321.1 Na(+)/H(+) antiporter subunit B [Candidatus Nezhaarchaeota archaeon]MDW8050706.1 Na(+)/H(+) antiporter subunit B [Nitrososphaerota archaeon]